MEEEQNPQPHQSHFPFLLKAIYSFFSSPLAAMDLEDLKGRFYNLKSCAEEQEGRVRHYESKAQNTAMAYLIWERLFAFGMSHYYNCSHYWWMLLGFTLSSTALYFLFFLAALVMFYRAHTHLERISAELARISQLIMDAYGLDCRLEVQVYKYRPLQITLYILFTLSALLSVTAFQLYISYYTLCNSSSNSTTTPPTLRN